MKQRLKALRKKELNSQYEDSPHIGSSFDNFLSEEEILDKASVVVDKHVIAWQISESMSALKLIKRQWQKNAYEQT